MRKHLYLFTFIIVCIRANAQNNATPFNINALYDGKEDVVKISYEIINASSTDLFDVYVEAYKDNKGKSEKIKIVSISGDIKNVSPNNTLNINWQQRKDGHVFDDDISFVILISRKPYISLSKHLIKSAIFPGWGDYKIGNNKHYFFYGLAGYGLITGSILLNKNANTNYNAYKGSYNINESNNYYKSAVKANNYSYWAIGGAALVWSVDILNVYNKVQKAKKDLNPKTSKYYYEQSLQRTQTTSNKIHLNTKNNFDIALEKGNSYYDAKKYDDAKREYDIAYNYNSASLELKNKLENVNSILKLEEEKEIKYQEALKKGNDLFDKNEYNSAIAAYDAALKIKPEEKEPQQKKEEIKRKLAELEKQNKYQESIKLGDIAFQNKRYEIAIDHYNIALSNKQNDPIAIDKIEKCNNIIDEANYQANIKKAKSSFEKKDFENTIIFCDDALNSKPDDITAIALKEKAQAIINKNILEEEYSTRLASIENETDFEYQIELLKRLKADFPNKSLEIDKKIKNINAKNRVIVPFTEENGVFYINVSINTIPMKIIFDTGASDVSISLTEALFLLKNGNLKQEDIGETVYYGIANGSVAEGTKINLKTIKVGGITIYNVEASIVHELKAPLLFGQSAIKKLGNYTFDYKNKRIVFE